MVKNEKEEIAENIDHTGDWIHFVNSYIVAAQSCADAFLAYDPRDKSDISGYTFIPAFWNFKHAIELGIKFLFPSQKPFGHNLIVNLEKYKTAKNLSDKECKELKKICVKYVNLKLLQELKNVRGNNFVMPQDYENQFFHYPEKNKIHRLVYGKNKFFTYNLLTIQQPENNLKAMGKIMEELKKDTEIFLSVFAKHVT